MKKTKHSLIVLVLAVFMAMTVSLLAACSSCKDKNPPTPEEEPETVETLQSIELDTEDVKVDYLVGEAFTSEGLKVMASILVETGDDRQTVSRDVTSSANINSSQFKSDEEGEYEITITYTLGRVVKAASYMVTVIEPRYGVDIILLDNVVDGITLNEDKTVGQISLNADFTTVTLDPTKIEVREPDEKGVVDYESPALDASEYTVKVFKNATEEITAFTDLSVGSYEIWIYMNADTGYIRKNFVQVFVNDGIVSFAFDNTASGTRLSQVQGDDEISSTWKFKVTTALGEVTTLTIADLTDVDGRPAVVNTRTVGEQTITLYYTSVNSSGAEVIVHTTVDYVITEATGTVHEEVNISKLIEDNLLSAITYTDNIALSNAVTITADSKNTVAVDESEKKITVGDNEISLTHRLKLGGKGSASSRSIKIEVTCAATVTVYMLCSSSSETRDVGLYDSDFSLISGSVQTVGGSGNPGAYTYNLAEAGTYYIAAETGGTNIYYIIVDPVADAN